MRANNLKIIVFLDNIAYSFHFSAGTDGEKQLGYLQEAIDNEVCVVVTE